MSTLDRRQLFGLSFVDAPAINAVVDTFFTEGPADWAPQLPLLVTPNVDHLVQLEKNPLPAVVESTHDAAFVLPDGQPIVWASRLLGEPLRARLTGSDLFPPLWTRIRDADAPVLVVAPSDDVGAALRDQHDAAVVVVPPIFDARDAAAVDTVVAACLKATTERPPEFVLICIGQPKQQVLALALLEAWPDSVPRPRVACLGAAAEMYLGIERRAPAWMRSVGLEWLYRFIRSPRRLFRRYVVDDTAFARIAAREVWRARTRRRRADR